MLKKDYKFKIEDNIDEKTLEAYQSIKIYTKGIDNETLLLTLNGGGAFSLYLNDRFFNFNVDDETNRVSSFEGELNAKKIQLVKLQLPKVVKTALLTLISDKTLQPGTGSYIEFNTDYIAYDKEKKILQLGDINSENVTYKFFNNAYAQIKDGDLSGLMFTEMEL